MSKPSTISLKTNLPYEFYPRLRWLTEVLTFHWGATVTLNGENCDVTICYGPTYFESEGHSEFIPFNEKLYQSSYIPISYENENDTLGVIFRLMNLIDEESITDKSRDNRGIFKTAKLPRHRHEIAGRPLVDELTAKLWSRLKNNAHELNGIDRWPAGKKSVLLLTHDVDALNIAAWREIRVNVIKWLVRRDERYKSLWIDGVKFKGPLEDNPFYGFFQWQNFLQNYKSCFYIYFQPPCIKRALNDPKSDVITENVDWSKLKKLAHEGFEFGIHPPINAKDNQDSFMEAKAFLEDRIEMPIYGLRHHYWNVDWKKPYMTYRKHINAGFRYDTSLAWKDAPGFRAATSLPFRPFDPVRKKALDFYAIPTSLMDGHILLPNKTSQQSISEGIETIKKSKNVNGIAVLDWHNETICNKYQYANYIDVLGEIFEMCIDDTVWVTTPWELVKHWHARWKSITPSIYTPNSELTL